MVVMADNSEPSDGNEDVSSFRLPPIGLGRCMVPDNGDSDAGCLECVATHYNGFARVTESGDEYVFNDCSRHYTKLGWRAVAEKLRTEVKDMQGRGDRLSVYDRWVLKRKRNLLSKYDTAHTSRDPMSMPLEMLLMGQQVETLSQ